jgi:hypothetical protein
MLMLLFIGSVTAEDKLVLRDLTTLRDPGITSLDADGLVLSRERSGGTKLVTWDEIESVQLADEKKQQDAEQLLQKIGLPLYRLRVRLELGDDTSLLEPAESLYETFAHRRSDSAYLVLQSLVWGRLAHGQREAAVEPWLLAYEVLRSRAAKVSDLPGTRRPQLDPGAALLGELEPVWFDAEASRAALPKVEAALATFAEPIPSGARLYAASLALAAGDVAKAAPYLDAEVPPQTSSDHLQAILRAQRELLQKKPQAAVERLRGVLEAMQRDQASDEAKVRIDYRPLALFWLARAQQAAGGTTARDEALLTYMRIPALYARQSPELAAAALFEVSQAYGSEPRLAAKLRAELREQFAGTWYAQNLAAQDAASR